MPSLPITMCFSFPDRNLLKGQSPAQCQGSLDQLWNLAERHLRIRDGFRAQSPAPEVVPEQVAADETQAVVSRAFASQRSGWFLVELLIHFLVASVDLKLFYALRNIPP